MSAAPAPWWRRQGRRAWGAVAEPSLVRRVVLALLAAFSLGFAALVAVDMVGLHLAGPENLALPHLAQATVRNLPGAQVLPPAEPPPGVAPADWDRWRAVAVVRSLEGLVQDQRQQQLPGFQPVLVRLETRTGQRVYESAALAGMVLPAEVPADARLPLWGQTYWMARSEHGPWRLTLLEPQPADVVALRQLSADLIGSFLIVFPLVLLPLWLAVRRGLQPLQALVNGVATRAPDDDRPLGLDLRYAELKPLLQAFEALLARSRQHIARERALVHDAAHELRTPLAVVAAQAHRLAQATEPSQREPALRALEHGVARSSHLVHQLLTLAALEDGQALPAPTQALELVALTRQLIINAMPRAQARGIELGLASPEHLPAWLDGGAYQSILDNLLGNALAYVHDGAEVLVSLQASPGAVQLSVADNGPGIAPAERERLFERFQRGHGVRSSGSGLGLAIVRQAVQRLGGQLQLGPGLGGRGVAFEVNLPQPAGPDQEVNR